MGLVQWIVIIVLVAIILFGFAAVFDFGKGVLKSAYPLLPGETFIISNVTKVIDGDTIEIQTGDRIRFALANTPEKRQIGWAEAKNFTTQLCLGKEAAIDRDNSQSLTYGRMVGMVYCDGINLSVALVMNNLAVVMKKYCQYSEFKEYDICQYAIE